MNPKVAQSKLAILFKRWQPLVVLIAVALWTVLTAGVSGYWAVHKYTADREDAQTARDTAREDAERNATIARRIEAQRPFLERKLALYFTAIETAGKLTEWDLSPDSQQWKENAKRFWELRWSELEMVGDSAIRQAARRVGQQIVEVEFDPKRERHDLRWMVECLADELRLALEHAWGFDPMATRITATEDRASKLPNGCSQDRTKPERLNGMLELHAPGNR
jgi:hypothetical protein